MPSRQVGQAQYEKRKARSEMATSLSCQACGEEFARTVAPLNRVITADIQAAELSETDIRS